MARSKSFRSFVGLCLIATALNLYAQQAFSFVALGDLPYGNVPSSQEYYARLIERINQNSTPFSIHVGDFKSGSTLCTDDEFSKQLNNFQSYSSAVIYTPGDNEWTDCHRSNNGSFDPLERLSLVRKMFFRQKQSLGKYPIQLESQSLTHPNFTEFVENQRWRHLGVLFNTLHIVGSNNNFESRSPSAVNEFFRREQANVAWIRDAFSLATSQKADVIVFAFQADVFESKSSYEDFPGSSGYRKTIGETLLPLAQKWGKPVLIIHGDSHRFKIDQPFILNMKPLTNVTRLVVPGADDVRAVEVTVNGADLKFSLVKP